MRNLVGAVLVMFAGGAAEAQDCDSNMDQQSLNMCVHESYLVADADLNIAYDDAIIFTRDLDETGSEGVEEALRTAQRAWIAYRDAACASEAALFGEGSMAPMVYSGCLLRLTEARTLDLYQFGEQF